MALNNNDWNKWDKKVKDEGYRAATSFNGYVKNDGSKITNNGGSTNVNGTKYSDYSSASKSKKL